MGHAILESTVVQHGNPCLKAKDGERAAPTGKVRTLSKEAREPISSKSVADRLKKADDDDDDDLI